jgi:lipoprotein-anchoring transpeptidase ErfK/SrfK
MGYTRKKFWVGALALVAVLRGGSPAGAQNGPPPNRIVVSVPRQRLYEYHGGRLTHVLPVSTASGHYYFSKRISRRVRSFTPRGQFRIRGKMRGWKRSEYGRLYYPSYFDRAGHAIHGYRDLRPFHSHGCIRIPMRAARSFWRRNPVGTRVYVE